MVAKLYNQTPLHRDNFIRLVKQEFYDSLLFHRVIKKFIMQGGDPIAIMLAILPKLAVVLQLVKKYLLKYHPIVIIKRAL